MYYIAALPVVSLFALGQSRFFASCGILFWLIAASAVILPDHVSFIKNSEPLFSRVEVEGHELNRNLLFSFLSLVLNAALFLGFVSVFSLCWPLDRSLGLVLINVFLFSFFFSGLVGPLPQRS